MKKFNVGDTLVSGGLLSRIVVSKNSSLCEYGLSFVDDPDQTVHKWAFDDAHGLYKLYIPDHIPQEQHERYIKQRNLKYSTL